MPNELSFNQADNITIVLAELDQELLMARSQAKRILRGLESRFKHVTLDFKGIRLVGQGFVDEVFRVFANKHPEIHFKSIHTNEDVDFMIRRGIATAKAQDKTNPDE